MKLYVPVVCVLIAAVYCDEYTNKYDSLNLDEILANKRLMNAYIKCLKGTGKCTPEGNYLKTHISDALQTGCSKCNTVQYDGVVKVISYMVNNAGYDWDELVSIYDPQGIYSNKYKDQLVKIKN